MAENKNSIDLIRKDLLRRKIQEHFSKNPKSKSVIIRSGIGGNTVWKVSRRGKDYKVVEVNTARKEFLLSEAIPVNPNIGARGAVGGQAPGVPTATSAGQTPQQFNIAQFAELDPGAKMEMLRSGMVPLNGDSIAMIFTDYIKPGTGRDIVALRDFVQQNASKVQPAAKGAVGSALGFLTNLSNQKRLMSNAKSVSGGKLREALPDEEEEMPPPEDQQPAPAPEEEIPTEPKGSDSGLEVGPPDDGTGDEEEAPKTGEEMQLDQLVDGKPIQGLDIFEDEHGDHVVLSLAGLTNELEIVFPRTGGIKYKVGDLVRVMKSSGMPKDKIR